MKKKLLLVLGGLFAGIGAFLLILAAFLLYRDADFAAGAERVQGRVLAITAHDSGKDARYNGVIEFIDQRGGRHELIETISTNPPRFSAGESVSVLYDPARPMRAVVDDFWGRKGIAAIVTMVGAPFAIIGSALLFLDIRRRRRRNHLRRHGRSIEADFLHVYRDASLSFNGDNPFRVVAQGPDPKTGKLRRFESAPIWVDPGEHLQGRKLRVFVDRENGDIHDVDLSDILAE